MTDRWANAPTVDFGQHRPVRAQRLRRGEQPPNLPTWPSGAARNVRADIPRDPRRRAGRWLWPS